MKWLAVLVMVVVVAGGCVTPMPFGAVGGKTHAKVEFYDVIDGQLDPETGQVTGGQDTRFTIDVTAPAGVEVAELVNMAYKWDQKGNGEIAVSKDGALSTQGQAEMIPEVAKIQAEMLGAVFKAAFEVAAQSIGAYQTVSVEQIEAQKRAAELNAGTSAVSGAVEAALKAAGK